MRRFELQSVVWLDKNRLRVAFRVISFCSGSSELSFKELTIKEFREMFDRKPLPPKPQK